MRKAAATTLRSRRSGLVSGLAGLLVLGVAPAAFATVAGIQPSPIASYQVFGDAITVGNTLMVPTNPNDEEVNNHLLQSSEGFVSGFPCDGVLEAAYLFWSGSTDIMTDNTADFTLADGTVYNDVIADQCRTIPSMGGFYYCRSDVTTLLMGHTAGCGYNGMYVVGDVMAMEGDYNSSDPDNGPCFAQAKYAAWSLVLVYSDPEGIIRRDVVVYDGFLQLDEDSYNPGCGMSNPTPGVDSFTIGGFNVGTPPRGRLTIFGLEGDDQLGVPPQTNCTTCYDYLSFNGTKLYDTVMAPNNVFNGSTSVTGVDIDSFDIGETGFNLLQPGQTSAAIEVGSGDGCVSWNNPGCPADPEGGGESFFLGWMVLSLDTLSPLFIAENTRIWFDEHTAGAGETVWMNIRVQNDGNHDANDVRVWNTLPPGLEYVPGTTSVDGTPVADAGGTSPLYSPGGLLLGRIRWDFDREREIRFQVRVDPDVADGTQLCSTATVDAAELPPFETDPTNPCLTVEAPSVVDPPLLSVQDINGGFVEPGDVLRYRATFVNDGERDATALRFTLDLPPYVRALNVVSIPAGADDQSTVTGGANGTGFLDIRDVEIPSSFAVEVLFEITIFTEAELLAAGVPPTGIDGLTLSAQGTLAAPYLPSDYLTDDPDTAPAPDPTVVVLTYRPLLTGTNKSGVDVDGGRTEPGDVLRYTVAVHNVGNRPATVDVTDDLPAGVTGCVIVSGPPGTTCVPPPAGANGTGQVVASGASVPADGGIVSIVFEVMVAADAADGLSIVNTAFVAVLEDPGQNRTVSAPAFTVYNRPDFTVAAKTVQDMNGAPFEPGDPLTFTIRYVNNGNRPATNVVVSDPVDANLTNVTPGQGGVYAMGQITWAFASVAPGEEILLTFSADIASPLANGTIITNRGILRADEIGAPVLTNNVQFTVTSAPDLSTMTKVVSTQDLDGDGQVSPGDRVDYTILVRNTGNAVATGVVVTDVVDPGLENVTVGQGGQLAGGLITWSLGTVDLSPAGDVILTFSASIVVPLEDGTVIDNQAFAAGDGIPATPSDDPGTPALDDPTRIVVHSQAEVAIAKTVSDPNGGDPMPGDTLLYEITVSNSGNAPALDLVVTDVLPAELTNPAPGQGGQVGGSTITWNAGTTPALARVVPGQPVVLTFSADLIVPLPNGTTVCNQASVTGPVISAPACVTVQSYPVVSESQKTVLDLDGDGQYNPGDRVRYTLTIRNTGTETVTNVIVTDVVDTNLTSVSVGQGGSLAGSTITWPAIASIAPDGDVVFTFEGDIVLPLADGILVSNQGMITSSEVPGPTGTDDPATPAPGDPTVFVVESAPDLTLATKNVEDLTGDPGRVEPGDTLRYTILVSNTGTDIARNTTVTDTIDPNLEAIAPNQGGMFDGAGITWDATTTPALASLSPLDPPVALTFTARVIVPTMNGTVIENQGFLTREGDPAPVPTDDPRTAPDDDPTRVTVISASDLTSSTKVVHDEGGTELPPGALVVPGQLVRYTLTLSNDGNDAARNVSVRDPVDASLTVETIGQGGRLVGGEIQWNAGTTPGLGLLDPDGQLDLTFSARLNVPLDNGTLVLNQAWMLADDIAQEMPTDDPRTPALDDPAELTVLSAPDLASTVKTVEDLNGGDFEPGDTVRYRIRISNTGDAFARNVVVTDPVDLTFFEEILPGEGGVLTGGTIRWDATTTPALTAVDLSPQGDVELTFTARLRVPLDDGTLVSNQAFAQADGMTAPEPTDDPATADVNDPTVFEVRARPDLSALAKTVVDVNGGAPAPGDLLAYTVQVTNTGNMTAVDVALTDAVDEANLVDIAAQDGGTLAGGVITWDASGNPGLSAVAPGDVINLRFEARVRPLTPGGTQIDNQANAHATGLPGPVPSDDPGTPAPDDPTRVVVVASPDFLASSKTVTDLNGGALLPGERLAYALVVRNTGNTYASHVVVRDPLDARLEDVVPGQGGVVTAGAVVWDQATVPAFARLDPGVEVVLTFEATVTADVADGTIVSNQGFVDADEIDPPQPTDDPGTPEPSDPTDIRVQTPDLGATTKTVSDLNGERFEPGDPVQYVILVPNSGSLDATSVVVTDQVPDAHLIDIQPQDGGVIAGDTITWQVGTVPASGRAVLRFDAVVRPMTPGGTVVENQAVVAASELPQAVNSDDPATPDADDPTGFTVVAAPSLDAGTKTVEDLDGGVVQPGDELRYTIVVQNDGNTWADDVTVTDAVDTRYLEDIQPAQGGVFDGSTITWTAATTPALARVGLTPDGDVSLAFTARVREGTPNATVVANQAYYACEQCIGSVPSDDPGTPDVDDPTRVTVVAAPLFSSSRKEVEDLNGGLVEPGDVLEYTVLVVNNGSETANGTLVRDSVPARTSYLPGSTTLNGGPVPDGPGGVSPLVAGMSVHSARAGTPQGTVWVDDGSGASDAVAVVTFRVRVEAAAQTCGASVANKAWVWSDRTDPVATNVAEVTVGDCPNLNHTVKGWYIVEDHGTQGLVEPGDAVAFDVLIENTGPTRVSRVVFIDPIPARTSYLPGTLTLGGMTLTDAADADAGEITGEVVTVRVGGLAGGDSARITFHVRVEEGPRVVNQGTVTSLELPDEPTDDDGDETNGDNPTVIPVGDEPLPDLSTSRKEVEDTNGGTVLPGDELRYTIRLVNAGLADAGAIRVTDVLPEHTDYAAGSLEQDGRGLSDAEDSDAGTFFPATRTITYIVDGLAAGEETLLAFRVRVQSGTELGTIVDNVARIATSGIPAFDTNHARVIVGGGPDTGGVRGRVFVEMGERNGSFDEARDEVLAGFQVLMRLPSATGEGALVASAVSDDQGRFFLMDLEPGPYALHAHSSTGVEFTRAELTGDKAIAAGQVVDRDLPIDPSGRVYDSTDGTLLPGVVATLYYDDENTLDPGQKVATTRLPYPSQQDQVTDGHGMYAFDVQAGHKYRVVFAPASTSRVFPSVRIPPSPGFAGDLLEGGRVVATDLPDPQGDARYFLRFEIGDEVHNNHVPVDRLEGLLRLGKSVNKRVASVGDIVTYTLTLQNGSGQDLDSDWATTGIWVQDRPPRGFKYLDGSARVEVLSPNGDRQTYGQKNTPTSAQARGGLMSFGPFPLPAGQTLRIRYHMGLGSDIRVGDHDNRARAYLPGNVPASNLASSRVRVVHDPVFDEALIIGKVFCDVDGDLRQDAGGAGERGIPGAQVYIDTGWFAETDVTGKYHLKGIGPGLHQIKIDTNTLPPGSKILSRESNALHLTRGLPAKLNFAVACNQRTVTAEAGPSIAGPVPRTALLTGDVDDFALTFQERPVTFPDLTMWVGDTPGDDLLSFDLIAGRLQDQLHLGVSAPIEARAARWSLEILDPNGLVVDTLSGSGSPGDELIWNPEDQRLEPGTYQAQLHVFTPDGTQVTSAPVPFGVGIHPDRVEAPIYPARLEVNGRELAVGEAASFSYQVPVQTDGAIDLDFTRANGPRVRTRLMATEPPGKRKIAIAGNTTSNTVSIDGALLPLTLGSLDATLTGEETLRTGGQGLAVPASFQVQGDTSGLLNWQLVILDAAGSGVDKIAGVGSPGAKIAWEGPGSALAEGWYRYHMVAEDASGHRVQTPVRLFYLGTGTRTTKLSPDVAFRGRTAVPTKTLTDKIAELAGRIEAEPEATLRIEIHADNRGGSNRAMARTRSWAKTVKRLLSQSGAPDERVEVQALGATRPKVPNLGKKNMAKNRRMVLVVENRKPPAAKPRIEPSRVLRLGDQALSADQAGAFTAEIARQPGDQLELVWDDAQGRRITVPVQLEDPEPAPVAAPAKAPVHLRVVLPPADAEVRSEKLVIRGQTDPGNQVTVNGKATPVDEQGRFQLLLPVDPDTKEVRVTAANADGQKAEIVEPLKVARHVWFLMALADTAVAELEAGEHLDGVTKRTSFVAGDKVLLHGRAVLYFKARIQGKHLFDQYRITAHLDTAKGDDEAFFQQVIDPDRYYPVYGDSGAEVQDVQARRKLYVLVEADESKLLVGNFRTRLKGIDVLRYDRTFYGGQLVFKKVFAKDWDTDVRAHVADGDQQVRHAHVELVPTGGSLYYLPHAFMLEGSEQVRIVVRDRETGMVLMQVPKQRDADYTIRYREGRILFHGPVASTLTGAQAGLGSVSSNTSLVAEGNPVSIEVDYEYEGGRGPGEMSWAVQAHETWRETVRVGGTFVQEGRVGDDFRLWGVDLTLQDPDNKQTYVKAEFARSENTDADNYFSPDGGLSFTPLGPTRPGQVGHPLQGDAWKVTAGAELGPYLGYQRPLLNLSGYFQDLEPGFFSNGMLLEQGQRKFGGRVAWHVTKAGTLELRHDGGISTLFAAGLEREMHRQVSRLGYAHTLGALELAGEYLHTAMRDNNLFTEWQHGDAVGAGVKYRLSKRWRVFGRQEAILKADGLIVAGFGDRMKTSVGVSYDITDELRLEITEALRWSGDNATVVGFSTKLSDTARIYANERFNLSGGRYISTTVLGAEDEPLKGVKTYGEYQLNGASTGVTNRAVLGLANHFTWGQGWSADLTYERTQVFGDGGFGPAMHLGGGTGSAMLPDGINGGSGFEGVTRSAMPNMNAYGNYLAGDSSRDSVSAGLLFKGPKDLKLSLKIQFRYDDADDDMITNVGPVSVARPFVKDRLQFLGMAALSWKWTQDLSFALHLNFADTEQLETERDGVVYVEAGTEARLMEGSAGLAFRPVHYDWVAVLGKYTILIERRPLDLLQGLSEESQSHVFTIMPIIDIEPLRLQIVEKLAWKYVIEKVDGLPDASGHTVLWINRLNFHILRDLDLGGEYRILYSGLADDMKHGFLVEVAYVLMDKIRIGAGYNFTSFSDNEFDRSDYDHGGFFFRVTGQY